MQRKPLIKERLTEQLRDMVLANRQEEFVKIAPERELAEQWSVSRISLRAAIKTLIDEGLLQQVQGKGTYICPKPKPAVRPIYILCPPDMKRNDPYYSSFLVEITTAAAKLSIPLGMMDPEQGAGDSDGVLIVVGLPEASLLERLSPLFGHVMLLQSDSGLQADLHISFDDRRIGRDAVRMLMEHGHSRLIHLAGPGKYPSAADRKNGFLEEAAARGLEKPVVLTEKMNWAGGYKAGHTVLELLAEPGAPTAIFAANDWMAAGLTQKLKEHGVLIPDRVSIIGCDDITLAADLSPSLSTFHLDMKVLACEVLEAVHKLPVPGRSGERQQLLLPATFIKRESIGFPLP